MPVRILLADKSITIQKVVEMLFSGKEYEVVSVSDGETALSEARRTAPDVVLADVDLPRLDGYTFSERLKKDPKLAKAPVILMMSRDDVYDAGRGKQAEIIDTIVKPFESQELIGKVKKALLAAPPRGASAVPQPPPAPPRKAEAAVPPAPAAVKAPLVAAKPKAAAPADIFDIISEAPTQADVKRAAAPAMEESVYEVEPVVEVEEVDEPLGRDVATALPTGAKAVEEMRAGLGLTAKGEEPKPEPELFEAFDLAMETEQQPAPSPKRPVVSAPPPPAPPVQTPTLPESELRKMAEQTIAKMAKDVFAKLPPVQAPSVSDEMLRGMVEEKVSNMAKEAFAKLPAAQPQALSASDMWSVAEETVQKIAKEFFEGRQSAPALQSATLPEGELGGMAEEVFKQAPPPQLPKISEETVRRGIEEAVSKIAREVAREVIEKVAWEVIPQLAEVMIKEEIERLKAET